MPMPGSVQCTRRPLEADGSRVQSRGQLLTVFRSSAWAEDAAGEAGSNKAARGPVCAGTLPRTSGLITHGPGTVLSLPPGLAMTAHGAKFPANPKARA